MPGYDGTGPLGAGSRTGWGRGRCALPADQAPSTEVPHPYRGRGWGYGPRGNGGGGGRRLRGRGRGGAGRGFGRAAGAMRSSADLDDTRRQQEPSFRAQIEALEEELQSLKRLLSKYSPDDGQDPE